MMLRPLVLTAFVALAACAPGTQQDRAQINLTALPPMKTFAAPHVTPPNRSNASLAADFLDLSFMLESGRPLPVLTRFEGPVTIRVLGQTPPGMQSDLDRLIARFRSEAGIDIRRARPDSAASITIELIPRAELQRAVPQAACFVVPRVSGWSDFKRNRRTPVTDWATLEVRERMAVFIPSDVAPQEVRDCLHEEVAQALGPLNDLYRLTDSVFNDDNFRTVLTGFDMLMLRITYASELHSGMDRATVAHRLPAILSRLNPAGDRITTPPRARSSRAWITEIETALGPRATQSRRREAAKHAVELARAANWNDNRLAFSLFALGRLSLGRDPELALAAFLQAGGIYAANPNTQIHEAHIAMQLAAFALSSGQAKVAIDLIDRHLATVANAENAALLANLMLVKVEALDLLGRTAEVEPLRRDSLGWARYGFGSDAEVRKRAAEIAALNPRRRLAAKSRDAS